jgi:hypothetical protein
MVRKNVFRYIRVFKGLVYLSVIEMLGMVTEQCSWLHGRGLLCLGGGGVVGSKVLDFRGGIGILYPKLHGLNPV